MFDNQLKKPAQLRESVLALVVVMGVFYATYATFYTPKKQMAEDLSQQVNQMNEQIASIEKLNQALIQKNAQAKREMQKQAQEAIKQDPRIQMLTQFKDPVFKDVSEFLHAITQFEFRSSLEIDSLNYLPSVTHKGYKSTAFDLVANGRFAHVIEFIERLEDIPALLALDKIQINVSKKDSSQVSLQLNGTFFELEKDDV
ncbi:MAG: type 4a pilus biogenesis protein PilO [Deltaproteobacteria bacterium]|nr:type 4a pilus biogenesis protein PilO [Deltaproteobacteria bacterium]